MTLAKAWRRILKFDLGLKCPYGCKGCSVRYYGLVSHLMEKHNRSKEQAEKLAKEVFYK